MEMYKTKYGYFSEDASEYVITNYKTPKPWVNVISNGDYGLVISQLGGGFSWKTHSEFNRLNRWHQDLIQDNWGKYFYFRDNATNQFWSNTVHPVKSEPDYYLCKHGFGYTKFISKFYNIESETTVFVPLDKSCEIWNFKITNKGEGIKDLSLLSYFEWCLGSSADFHREFHKSFIETEFDDNENTMYGNKRLWEIPLSKRGHWNIEYPFTGYISCNKKIVSFDGDKETFIGNYGNLDNPAGLLTKELKNTQGKWNDSIGSVKINLTIKPGETEEVIFVIGIAENKNEIKEVRKALFGEGQVELELKKIKERWDSLLNQTVIDTPDPAMNIMYNKWLKYQTISGRLWARTAYYQQSGAYGFRDQLQDSLVYLTIDPEKTKEQIRLHAKHQFTDGTVLHWWHPISETGLETTMTDDLLWLPFLVMQYMDETNDYDILDIAEEYYNSKEKDILYNHCKSSIDKVFTRFSERGLPLIGAGDWNDGLSAVGLEMKGESIWLAHFLCYILDRFSKIAEKRDEAFAVVCNEKAKELRGAINKYAWDGKWFFRATKDNGVKIGSAENDEGKIFLNAQTWSVIANTTDENRKKQVLDAVKQNLLKDFGTLLLSPAYTKPDEMIGYLSRYAPGRRENGGVYTHAATWSVWAFALMKDQETAYECYKRINPALNALNPDKYVAEPYVTPGNIDGPESPNYGMAGWTWYTGSSNWLQKVILDWILGVRAVDNGLLIDPCIPKDWKEYSVKRKFRSVIYNIKVINESGEGKTVKKAYKNGELQQSEVFLEKELSSCEVLIYL